MSPTLMLAITSEINAWILKYKTRTNKIAIPINADNNKVVVININSVLI